VGDRFRAIASRAGRAKYLVPPLLAILVVVGVQLTNSSSPATVAPNTAVPVVGASDLTNPQTEISSVGTVDTSDVDRRITFWKQRTQARGASELDWNALGDVFDLKGRMTGDVSQYVAAKLAYESAIGIAANSSAAHAGDARVLATLHDFNGALAEATRTVELNANALGALGVIFDSSVELGQIDVAKLALTDLQRSVDGPSISVREARLAFLRGDTASAVQLAEGAAADSREAGDLASNTAFFEFTAAEYQLFAGNLDSAGDHYSTALALLPGYPLAIFGEARVAYARDDLPGAITLMKSATAALPRPDMLAFLGDLYALSGDPAKAADQYATVDFIASMTESSGAGSVYDRAYSVFLSDHGRDIAKALTLASDELLQRKDIYGYDAYAWALHANGRDAEALDAVSQALTLGTADPTLLMHAGLIELANGLTGEGRAHLQQALALNPSVAPLVTDTARKALAQ
jgi:tetratricopeptide (TPR) repeat protein